MPTQSLTEVLLRLSNNADGFPWTCPTWQATTGVGGIPWAADDHSSASGPSPIIPEWTVGTARSVKVFAENFWPMSEDAQVLYAASKKSDNNVEGRLAWSQWVARNQRSWGLNQIIDEVLSTRGKSYQNVLSSGKKKAGFLSLYFPTAEKAQVYLSQPQLAERFFGDDAYAGLSSDVREDAWDFTKTLLTMTWARYRKAHGRDLEKMERLQKEVGTKWTSLSAPESTPTASQIKKFLRDLRCLLVLLIRYDHSGSEEVVKNYVADMEAMLAMVRNDPDMGGLSRVPKVIRDALANLASQEEVQSITQDLLLSLEHVQAAGNSEQVEMDLDTTVAEVDWKDGVEQLGKFDEDALWNMLGLPKKCLPFFSQWVDPDATIDPWSVDGQAWLKEARNSRQQLNPRWHQLIGIYRLLERAFDGKPVLLMDGVGLGKTLQVIGTITCLTYYRHHFNVHGKFPGSFANFKFQSSDANIPDLPYVIICPVNLREQWNAEIKRFLAPSTFDILPYVGRLQSRDEWWTKLFNQSQQPHSQRIILGTFSAIQDDATHVYTPGSKADMGKPVKVSRFDSIAEKTIFGREYVLVAVDEAHAARKHNVAHMAVRALRGLTKSLVAMTATPITTRPQDLYIMGQWMGIPGFDDHEQYMDVSRKINKASREDSKLLRQAGTKGSYIRGVLSGAHNNSAPELESPDVIKAVMVDIRNRFATHIIRRTIDSVDYQNQKLFGMRPYMEHIMRLNMHDWEMEALRSFAKDLLTESPQMGMDTSKHFYIDFRRSILHPSANPKSNCQFPKLSTLDEWKSHKVKTVKLDILGQILQHHLEKDGGPAVKTDVDGQSVTVDADAAADGTKYDECDRAIVFSAFPSSNHLIIDVLRLYGILATELNGSMSTKRRQSSLLAFRKSTANKGPRVLLLSNVGLVGLNLACANIMVIVDTTWSALDDEQLKGRIFRYPQKKQVHFYRLIALKTPDVFLNNISFSKGELHAAFVNSPDAIQNIFSSELVDNGSDAPLISAPALAIKESGGSSSKSVHERSRGPGHGRGRGGRRAGGAGGKGSSGKEKGPVVAATGAEAQTEDDANTYKAAGEERSTLPELTGHKAAGRKKPGDCTDTQAKPGDVAADMAREKPGELRYLAGGNKAGTPTQDNRPMPRLKRPLTGSAGYPEEQKRSRQSKTADDSDSDSNKFAEAAAAMQVEGTSRAGKGKGKEAPPTLCINTSAPIASSSFSSYEATMDDDDPILRALAAPGGEDSPDTEARKAGGMFEAQGSSQPPPPITSPPAVPTPRNMQGDKRGKLQAGMLAGVHAGVLGTGKDGTGNRGRGQGQVQRTHNTAKRSIRP